MEMLIPLDYYNREIVVHVTMYVDETFLKTESLDLSLKPLFYANLAQFLVVHFLTTCFNRVFVYLNFILNHFLIKICEEMVRVLCTSSFGFYIQNNTIPTNFIVKLNKRVNLVCRLNISSRLNRIIPAIPILQDVNFRNSV